LDFFLGASAAGLPDGKFSNKKMGKFLRDLKWKILVYFIAIWSVLRPFGMFYGYYICT
jgi:hypothetical protein